MRLGTPPPRLTCDCQAGSESESSLGPAAVLRRPVGRPARRGRRRLRFLPRARYRPVDRPGLGRPPAQSDSDGGPDSRAKLVLFTVTAVRGQPEIWYVTDSSTERHHCQLLAGAAFTVSIGRAPAPGGQTGSNLILSFGLP